MYYNELIKDDGDIRNQEFFMKFLFTCGGTAGHINPAVAVASSLQKMIPGCEVLFIGAENMMEMDLIPREGYAVRSVKITNLSRELSLTGLSHNVGTIKNVLLATAEAKRIIRSFRPDAVIGTGGYVCYPVIRAAYELHVPTLIHESNASPGLTTKMLSRVTDHIFVGFEDSVKAYSDPSRVEVTGTPVRAAFSEYTYESARKELGIEPEEKVILSVWGSLGAAHMNEVMLSMIPLLEEGEFRLIHCTGKRYYQRFMDSLYANAPAEKKSGVEVREYIHDMPRIMRAADLILCRAGASTLSELAFMGKPSFLVPSPNVTNHHQEKNARVLEHAGAAKVFLEGEFTAVSLLKDIRSFFAVPALRKAMAENMASLSGGDCADKIACRILEIISKKREGG